MTSLFGAGATLFGLAALAGGLFLLQRLRVRHRPVRVISTLFWKEAVEEARARVLVERFRHPFVYLFLLAICGLLWLAASGLETDDRHGRQHVVLLDGSFAMASGDRFESAAVACEEQVRELPRARRTVLFCGGELQTLLAPGEPDRLLSRRLEDFAPEATLPSIDRALEQLAPAWAGGEGTTVWIASSSPVSAEILAALPEGVTVAPLAADRSAAEGVRIVACGVSPAESGVWDRVDVLVSLAGSGHETSSIGATLAGQALSNAPERRAEGGRTSFFFRDLPARGGRFEAAIAGSTGGADTSVARRLPNRPFLEVELDPALGSWLAPALEADPAIRVVSSGGDLVIRRGRGDDRRPALEFVPQSAQEESILLTHSGSEESAEVLESALLDLGLDQVDAMELAEAAGRPITLGARPGSQRSIGVWEDLLAEEYNFTASRTFPLFVALAARWILEVEDFPAVIAAGESGSTGALAQQDGDLVRHFRPVGASFAPPRAGTYSDEDGDEVVVPLIAEAGGDDALTSVAAVSTPGSTRPLATLLTALVLVLLAVEWFLHRRGEVP